MLLKGTQKSIHGLYTQSWIQQKQLVEFDRFGTHGYMLNSLGYTVEYWIHQNQAKPEKDFGEFGIVRVKLEC